MKNSTICLLLWLFSYKAIAQIGAESSGMASYYAKKFNGRKTASGERFNNNDFTAAHRKFPYNTMLEVMNYKNNFTTIVRVNDRGPFKKGRIIDVSEAAARAIGLYGRGIGRVRLRVIGTNDMLIQDTQSVILESSQELLLPANLSDTTKRK